MHIQPCSFDQIQQLTQELPIEMYPEWAAFQDTIEGRSPQGYLVVADDAGKPCAVLALLELQTHGYHYLQAQHGPAYLRDLTVDEEQAMLVALSTYCKKHYKSALWLRLYVQHDDELMQALRVVPVLSSVPYDRTVISNLEGSDEDILARFKARGRRDVRKALRECSAQFADETCEALQDFAPYYAVMQETAQRDGFSPMPLENFQMMVRCLTEKHCAVFAARHEGQLVAWELCTKAGNRAVRYYAASSQRAGRMRVPDALLYYTMCELGKEGITIFDLMGIGSEFAPSLMGLNIFKTKFAAEETIVPRTRDLVLKPFVTRVLHSLKAARNHAKR